MILSAPRDFTKSEPALLAVVATVAPISFASWIAKVPTQPAPA